MHDTTRSGSSGAQQLTDVNYSARKEPPLRRRGRTTTDSHATAVRVSALVYRLTGSQAYQLGPLHVDLEEVDPIHAECGHRPRYGPHITRHLHLINAGDWCCNRWKVSGAILLRLPFAFVGAWASRCCRARRPLRKSTGQQTTDGTVQSTW